MHLRGIAHGLAFEMFLVFGVFGGDTIADAAKEAKEDEEAEENDDCNDDGPLVGLVRPSVSLSVCQCPNCERVFIMRLQSDGC